MSRYPYGAGIQKSGRVNHRREEGERKVVGDNEQEDKENKKASKGNYSKSIGKADVTRWDSARRE